MIEDSDVCPFLNEFSSYIRRPNGSKFPSKKATLAATELAPRIEAFFYLQIVRHPFLFYS